MQPKPLQRFSDVYRAVMSNRRWYESGGDLRYAALILTSAEGGARDIAERLAETARTLADRTGWFGSLRGMIGTVVAADLVRRRRDGRAFQAWVDEVTVEVRALGLPRTGMFVAIAALVLDQGLDRRMDRQVMHRMRLHHDAMKANHRWLTSADDLPACAMLALRDQPVSVLAQRCEAIYDGLRSGGMPRGNALQLASHLLCLSEGEPASLVRRFLALHRRFKEAGVAMWTSDFDEIASLAAIDMGAGEVVRLVLEHRHKIAELRPKPDRGVSFSLAAGTVLLESIAKFAVGADGSSRVLAQQTAMAQQAMMAQQAATAAVVAAIAAGSAAAAASSGGG